MVVQEAPVAKSCDARSARCVEALESGAHGCCVVLQEEIYGRDAKKASARRGQLTKNKFCKFACVF